MLRLAICRNPTIVPHHAVSLQTDQIVTSNKDSPLASGGENEPRAERRKIKTR